MKLNLEQSLYKAGLDEKEAKIYALLLKKGGATPSEVSNQTKINRSTVYKVLLRLSIKGIIGESQKGKKQYYFADRPSKLKSYKKGQVLNLERQMNYVDNLLPRLDELYQSNNTTIQSHYYEGSDIIKIYEDHVSFSNYEMLGIVDMEMMTKFSPDYSYWESYVKNKIKNNITTRGLLADIPKIESTVAHVYRNAPKWSHPVFKKLPQSFFTFQGEYIIYGDERVSLINLKEGELSGVIIVNKAFNQMMRNFFELIWQSQK